MLRHGVFVSVLILNLSLSNLASAQDYEALSKQYAEAASRSWLLLIKPKFIEALSPSDRTLVESIDFRFVPGGGAFDAFATRAQDGTRIVLISSAFVVFQDVAIDAYIVSQEFGLSDQYHSYLAYAAEKGTENYALLKSGEPMRPIPMFSTYAHLPRDKIMKFVQTKQYQATIGGFRILSLAYVLGHEIGHHVHGDYGKVDHDVQRQRENQADLYSTRLMLKGGFSPVGAIPVMMFFEEAGGDSDHPPPVCRCMNFMLQGAPVLMADPGFQRYADENPEVRKSFTDFTSQAKANRAEIERVCGQWLAAPP
jgi:hypothetical protein